MSTRITPIILVFSTASLLIGQVGMEELFNNPPTNTRPETWFHLIGGNVSKDGLTADLEAVAGAGLNGIQLFHGRGGEWPDVKPQIQSLSPAWEDMVAHIGHEAERLDLDFAMQNCPGWAMSGGPWITPDRAMRHLIWSRTDVSGGNLSAQLPVPQPSDDEWRDYRDISVLAFPIPAGDAGEYLVPDYVRSNTNDLAWADLLAGKGGISIEIDVSEEHTWLEVTFEEPVYLRSIELPPTELLMKRRIFDPETSILLEAKSAGVLEMVGKRTIPRGTWQDRQEEMALVLAFPDKLAKTFRISFLNGQPLALPYLRLSSAARINDWRGQAGYALRSLERSGPPVQDTKAWIGPESILDLSNNMDEQGWISGELPPGNWTIVRFGHVNTGIKNKPAPPEATGFECDKLSPLGAEQHFAGYIGRVTRPDGPLDGGLLDGMLIDSWECYTQTWTPRMESEFMDRRGYELSRWLPALAGWVVGSHESSERFLRDWRLTVNDLLVDHYFGRMAQLAHARGLKFSFETAVGDISPGDILEYYKKADIPMCEFWQPNDPHFGGFETKPIHPTVSAAHIYGKPVIAAEAFTNAWIRWDEHPWMLKHQADRHFALGINHLIFHTYTHNPQEDVAPGTSFGSRIGTPFLRGQTWWKHMPLFTDYLARCQYLLQQGKPVADVLWYLGDDLDHKPRQDSPFPQGFKFDYLNSDVLLNHLSVVDGSLQNLDGLQWKVLWLPEEQCRRMTPESLQKIHQLLLAGATVIGSPPDSNPSLSGGESADELFHGMVEKIWGASSSKEGSRKIGPGMLLWGQDLASMLGQLDIAPDVVGMESSGWFHRRDSGAEIYFISAGRSQPLRTNLRFRAKGRPELWDPLTGKVTEISVYAQEGDFSTVPVNLEAAGSAFIVFRPAAREAGLTRIDFNGHRIVDAEQSTGRAIEAEYPDYGLTLDDETQPWVNPQTVKARVLENGTKMLGWVDGTFSFWKGNQELNRIVLEGTSSVELDTGWSLEFPDGWGAQDVPQLGAPIPWSSFQDPETRNFSGSATYRRILKIRKPETGDRVLLDLGRVANIAEILINGTKVATLWAAPFRQDITEFLTGREDRLEVIVTNTWRNRLAHDASLPEDVRQTWTIHAPEPGVPVVEAGLIGPVLLRKGKIVDLEIKGS